jgi:hypothetical protein
MLDIASFAARAATGFSVVSCRASLISVPAIPLWSRPVFWDCSWASATVPTKSAAAMSRILTADLLGIEMPPE